MHTRRSSAPPMRVQVAQINHSLYPPRPPQDDTMSITTNQLDEEREHDLSQDMHEDQYDAEEEDSRPDDFSPRLWQLFNRIQRRGTEPLFPADWQLDFMTIPPHLFHEPMSEYLTSRPIISSLQTFKGSEFRGKQTFEKLTLLGQTVRNRMELNKQTENLPPRLARFLPVEPIIHGDCEKFVKWAEKDGSGGKNNTDLNTYLVLESARRFKAGPPTKASRRTSLPSRTSVHLPVASRTTEADYLACAEVMEERLRALAAAHHKTLQPRGLTEAKDFPTVFGLAICGPRLAIVALSAADPKDGPVRTLAVCDFTESDQDLWNAVAIAMVCLAARDESRERGQGDYEDLIRKLLGRMAITDKDEDL